MRLPQSVKLPPHQGVEDGLSRSGHLLVENDCKIELDTGVQVEDAMLQPSDDRSSQISIVNLSDFTQTVEEGCAIGIATEAVCVSTQRPKTNFS